MRVNPSVPLTHSRRSASRERSLFPWLSLTSSCILVCSYTNPRAAFGGAWDASVSREPRTMKVILLAGGFGTRLSEETEVKPKPMVEIGGRPMLWHIMKHYAHYGFKEFIVALGYRGEMIK